MGSIDKRLLRVIRERLEDAYRTAYSDRIEYIDNMSGDTDAIDITKLYAYERGLRSALDIFDEEINKTQKF